MPNNIDSNGKTGISQRDHLNLAHPIIKKNRTLRMGMLFEELKRRKVFRVAAVYAIVAWLLIQVAATVFACLANARVDGFLCHRVVLSWISHCRHPCLGL